jgi:hypothetical protein
MHKALFYCTTKAQTQCQLIQLIVLLQQWMIVYVFVL